ncbi:hypothetical protein PG997_002081 [Apiospora hydei]|uniref:2EXR domain-containing protein n=1 Tax=Apiospora hydei TaxID=1337664 RepID=A0ABR1X8E8_9PEZI
MGSTNVTIPATEFPKFPELALELQRMIWNHALDQEGEERLHFYHRGSNRILPTKNNISAIRAATCESRTEALRRYTVELPVIAMTPLPAQPVPDREIWSFEDWVVETADVRWGSRYAEGYEVYINNQRATDLPSSWHTGYVYLDPEADRFAPSYDVSDEDNAEGIVDDAGCGDIVWYGGGFPDLVAYQMVFDFKAAILGEESLHRDEIQRRHISLPLPDNVLNRIRNVVNLDIVPYGKDPDMYRGPVTKRAFLSVWYSEHFRQLQAMVNEPNPRALKCLIPEVESRTVVGKVERRTAECLRIFEIPIVYDPIVDDSEDEDNEDNEGDEDDSDDSDDNDLGNEYDEEDEDEWDAEDDEGEEIAKVKKDSAKKREKLQVSKRLTGTFVVNVVAYVHSYAAS